MSAPDCSLYGRVFGGNAILCSDTFKSYLASKETSQIQSVADNASSAYGSDSVVAQVTQQTATVQEKYAKDDTEKIVSDVATSKVGLVFGGSCAGEPGADLTLIGGPCIKYSTLKWIGAGVAVIFLLGVFLYAYSVTTPFRSLRGL